MNYSVKYRLIMGAIKKADRSLTTSVDEALIELVNYYFIDDSDSDDQLMHHISCFPLVLVNNDLLFEKQEVERVLRIMNKGKAPRPDDLPAEVYLGYLGH